MWVLTFLSAVADVIGIIRIVHFFRKNWSQWTGADGTAGEGLRSKHYRIRTDIEFDNRLPEPVDIYWINYEGGRQKYHTLRPGETLIQKTFVTHPWVITRVSDGKEVHRIIAHVY